jgi:Tfp pilus assembly protein PilF
LTSNQLSENIKILLLKAKEYLNSNEKEKALNIYDEVIKIENENSEAHFNKALILTKLQKYKEALRSYDLAIEIKPDFEEAYINRGVILSTLMRPIDALKNFDLAIRFKPEHSIAYNNKGNVLTELSRFDEAIENYEKAVEINPNYAEAFNNIALLKLLLGKYEEGWKLFEWRWKGPQQKEFRDLKKPLWLGNEVIKNKTILITAEQGLGDFIQFYRYCDLVEKLGAKIIIETPKELFSLIQYQNKKNIVIHKGQPLPIFDFYCPIMSLPLAFKTNIHNIPSSLPYIKINDEKLIFWRSKLGEKKRTRVGIAWSGAQNKETDYNRSLTLSQISQISPLFDLPLDFYSLQKEVRDIDKDFLSQSKNIYDYHKEIVDFSDTATLILEMDIIISVDTSVAHLAGALDKPLWILLPHVADYRWMVDRIDSPWYSSATLFRQKEVDNWDGVIFSIERSLRSYIEN